MSTWWFLTWTAPEIKEKVVHLSGIEYLYDYINPQQITIPPFVLEYDRQVKCYNLLLNCFIYYY